MLLFTLTISYVQVDLIGTHDLKLKLDQLQISFTKKEQEIDDHKRTIANLTNKMSQLEKTVIGLLLVMCLRKVQLKSLKYLSG